MFIEMTGQTLAEIVRDDEFSHDELRKCGIGATSIVRINRQGDIEVRRPQGWDVIGGLLGNYEQRIQDRTGMQWA